MKQPGVLDHTCKPQQVGGGARRIMVSGQSGLYSATLLWQETVARDWESILDYCLTLNQSLEL